MKKGHSSLTIDEIHHDKVNKEFSSITILVYLEDVEEVYLHVLYPLHLHGHCYQGHVFIYHSLREKKPCFLVRVVCNLFLLAVAEWLSARHAKMYLREAHDGMLFVFPRPVDFLPTAFLVHRHNGERTVLKGIYGHQDIQSAVDEDLQDLRHYAHLACGGSANDTSTHLDGHVKVLYSFSSAGYASKARPNPLFVVFCTRR